MDELDLELKLLSNTPIIVQKISIHHISIKQIAEFGYEKYNQGLKILCISKNEIESLINEPISPLEFLQMNMIYDPNVKKLLIQILSLVCRAGVIYSDKQQGFIVGKELLNRNNFDEVIDIIRRRNSIENEYNFDENPSNHKAKMLLERRKSMRNKLMKNNVINDLLTIPDLVSIVAVGLKLPMCKIMEYSIYQLSDQFKRLMAKENYDTTIKALLSGASKNDLDLKRWTAKKLKS